MEELLDNAATYIQSEQFIVDANGFLFRWTIIGVISLAIIALVSWLIIKKMK